MTRCNAPSCFNCGLPAADGCNLWQQEGLTEYAGRLQPHLATIADEHGIEQLEPMALLVAPKRGSSKPEFMLATSSMIADHIRARSWPQCFEANQAIVPKFAESVRAFAAFHVLPAYYEEFRKGDPGKTLAEVMATGQSCIFLTLEHKDALRVSSETWVSKFEGKPAKCSPWEQLRGAKMDAPMGSIL